MKATRIYKIRLHYNVSQSRLQTIARIAEKTMVRQSGLLDQNAWFADGKREIHIQRKHDFETIIQIKIRFTHYNRFPNIFYFAK